MLLFFKLTMVFGDRFLFPKALVMSIAWRVLFIFAILALPAPKGILNKGLSFILRFIFVDAAVNGLIIGILTKVKIPWEKWRILPTSVFRPGTSVVLVAVAVVVSVFI